MPEQEKSTEAAAAEVAAETAAPNPINDLIAQMTASNHQVANAVTQLASKQNAPAPSPVEVDPFAGVDPDTLTGARLAEYAKHVAKKELRAEMAVTQERTLAELTQLRGAVHGQFLAAASQQIEAIRAPDPANFDKLKPAMQKLAIENPRLTVGQLYKLARAEAVEAAKPPAAVSQPRANPASERPTHSAARPPARATRQTPLPTNTRAAFRQLLAEARQ